MSKRNLPRKNRPTASGMPRELVRQIIDEYEVKTVKDIENAVKDIFKEFIQESLEGELDNELGYSKYDFRNKDTDNSRNGYSSKKVKSSVGEIELDIPRDRTGEFEPQLVKKHQRDISSIEDKILSMYSFGMSNRDIQAHMEEMYGIDVSRDMVSKITDKIIPIIREWQTRPLEEIYPVIFMDAMHFNVKKDGQVVKKAAYVIMGYNLEGFKDILGIWIGENESAKFWMNVLNEFRNRGVKDILIACIDGLTGFETAIKGVFPDTEIQRCVIHQIRNSGKYVSYKDIKEFNSDLKAVYTSVNEEMALENFEIFSDKWKSKYPNAVKSWKSNWDSLATFFKYPEEIRTLIYTTNPIESFHSAVKKITRSKGSFPSDDALLKLIYLATQNVLKKWCQKRRSWDLIINQLAVYFEDRLMPYL
jgi:transposase-like protein